ncbi:C-type lectin domain-containing protein [Podarcis lilfordi]|uniref:C-type lectin domain-containing protein n=1 Tax=Podarcis lilfordi TaxID=74358 RepID=A0AA35L872_9SAUR|nr:C-type lectin domain-containing protein [Podarcis lilfordi]
MGFVTKFSLYLLGILVSSSFPGAKTSSCPRDWMQNQGNCYAYFDFKMSWEDAEIECQSYGRGTHLASILTEKEAALVAKHIATYQKNPSNVWIGLQDPRQNGRWRWADESTFNYRSWQTGEPNNVGGVEYCVELLHVSDLRKWNDRICDQMNTFICKQEL